MHSSTFIRGLAISFFAVVLLNACGGGGSVPGSSGSSLPGTSGSPAGTSPSAATLVTISVYPSPPASLPKGLTQKFTAMGAFSDYTWKDVTASVTWSSTAATVASINASGLATAVGVGTTNITASSGGISSTTVALNVIPATLQSIALAPTNPAMGAGQSTQFTATGSYSDGTTQDITSSITWNSSNTAAVTVSATGSAFGTAPGTATVTATSGSVSSNTVLTVAGYSVGGTQSLLPAGASVTLLNNGTDSLTLTNSTASPTNKVPFNFNVPLSSGAAYNVTVSAQPTGGVHPCTVVDGIGSITTTYLTSVQVVCGPAVGTYAGFVNMRGGATNGPAVTASFNFPVGIAVDAAGNMYVADPGNSSIRQITPAGTVSTLAGTGTVGFVNATGTAASFWQPYGVAVDSKGNVYVADANNNAIRKIAPGGVVTTFAGSAMPGFANGTGTAATFSYPTGIAVDKADNIYVADTLNNAIRMITPAGVVTTLAGSGTVGAANGAAATAMFSSPYGVAVDTAGNVYVADTGNNVIRKIAAGQVTTFAGTVGLFGGFANGTGTAAMFNSPANVAVDAAGNVYVSDRSNQLIRAITTAGVVTTLAGIANPLMGFSDGPALSAMFGSPWGIATDSTGHVYVSDNWHNVIRKFTP